MARTPSKPVANRSRIDIASIRREQIVEAAIAVIAGQGLQNLSLSEIENKAGMSRGQLTYYFPTKEDILLAVFDRLLQLMYQRIGTPTGGTDPDACDASGWEWVEHLFRTLLLQPVVSPEFHCLQYTFLSQISHRDDFRQRLASLYEEWRGNMAQGLAPYLAQSSERAAVSPRAMATLVQALLHGLAMQRAACPTAFDGQEMFRLCLDMVGRYLGIHSGSYGPTEDQCAAPQSTPARNGSRGNVCDPPGKNSAGG